MRSSSAIGVSTELQSEYQLKDPADMLKPQAEFRRANEASMGPRLWTRENEFDIYESKTQSKAEMCKT